ncbi:uncharacterized protein LOC108736702 isoform X2 [Agrilus planipennis]|uniref:Uncharacterized protein LOC108736702 isoform X2 n=1 Tax=Agrilus planipennis TaxID=224129 RepID=A0A7F5RM58_AGRPL|nr:uncharacterized protein LOC108736702 isoform X2 [Agrilus planipennis]
MKKTIIIFVTIITGLSQKGLALKCYQCNSFEDPRCDSLADSAISSKYYTDCKSLNGTLTPFCRKTTTEVFMGNDYRVVRACGWELWKKINESKCYKSDTDFKFQTSCQCFTDGCNIAPTRRPFSCFLLLILTSVLLIVKSNIIR